MDCAWRPDRFGGNEHIAFFVWGGLFCSEAVEGGLQLGPGGGSAEGEAEEVGQGRFRWHLKVLSWGTGWEEGEEGEVEGGTKWKWIAPVVFLVKDNINDRMEQC